MHSSRLALAGTLLAFACPAHAEEAEGATIIVTGATLADEANQRARATPGGADVVGHEDYADKSLISLRDALAFSPGVYLQPRFGQEVRISIRGSGLSRGFHMRGLTLLQDGVPINLADDNGDFQELEPIFFDHLEVYRGANALRFGSGTLGGAVNGVTPTGIEARGLYLRGDAGSFDTLRGLVSYGGGSDQADYWAAFSADTSDGDREHAHRQSLRFHGNTGFRLSGAVHTRFYASLNRIDQQLPGALTMEQALTEPETGNFFGDQARDIDSARVQNRTTIDLGQGRARTRRVLQPQVAVPPDLPGDRPGFERRRRHVSARLGPRPARAHPGRRSALRHGRFERYLNVDGKRGDLTFAADQKARTANLYGELRYRPLETLSLIAGGIYVDGLRRQHQTYNLGPSDTTARADFSELSPKLGVLYEPTAEIQLYANYSRSAEFPGFIELAQQAAFVPVEAQTAWTFEVGTRGSAGIASWDVSLYRSNLTSELLQYSVGPEIPASTFNADRTRHQGIEAGLSLSLASWASLRQVYQYSDFRFVDDAQYGDNRLPVIPQHVFRAELRLGGDALHVAPSLEWVPRGAWADYRNTTRTPGYALLGLTAAAKVSDNVDLFVDARNLTGRKAIGDIGAVVLATPASAIYYPIERRAVTGGVRARF